MRAKMTLSLLISKLVSASKIAFYFARRVYLAWVARAGLLVMAPVPELPVRKFDSDTTCKFWL